MYFTTKKVTTETYDSMLTRYENSNMSKLSDAYNKPSWRKERIFNDWVEFIGTGYYSSIKIIGYNCNFFSIMFIDLDSGDLYYITHANNYKYINPYN